MINRLANAFTNMAQRWVPDAYVIAILLTLVVFCGAVGWGFDADVSTLERMGSTVDAWGGGFWALLAFGMQMCIIMLGGFVLSQTRPVAKLLDWLSEKATTPTRAVLIVSLFSMLSALVNWGLSLSGSGVIARKVGLKCPKADFRLLVACAYLGMSATWHAGFSASAPLLVATEKYAQESGGQVIPTSSTILSPFNLVLTLIVIVVICLLVPQLHPRPEDTVPLTASIDETRDEDERSDSSWSDWLDRSWLMTLIVAAIAVTFLWRLFSGGDFGAKLNLDSVNLILLTLAIILHWTPRNFLKACEKGGAFVWGIIVQFPFYAGIYGMIKGTALQERVADFFVSRSTPETFPLVVYWYSGIVNYFVPSGGSKWYIEAPYIMEATQRLQVDPALTVLAYAWGDMMTDAIQPFWAIPLLGLAGLKFRDIMGFLTVVFLVYAALVSVAFLLAPRFF